MRRLHQSFTSAADQVWHQASYSAKPQSVSQSCHGALHSFCCNNRPPATSGALRTGFCCNEHSAASPHGACIAHAVSAATSIQQHRSICCHDHPATSRHGAVHSFYCNDHPATSRHGAVHSFYCNDHPATSRHGAVHSFYCNDHPATSRHLLQRPSNQVKSNQIHLYYP